MSNQQDDDFIDDDLDGRFSSSSDIPDAVEDSSVDDISDYDDAEEDEGIFAPPPAKKKQGSGLLLGTVAVAALLGAGGMYIYKNPDLLNRVTGGDAAPAVVAETSQPAEPAQQVAETAAPGAAIDPLGAQPIVDAELAAIPQPQPIANTSEAASAVISQTATTAVAPAESAPESPDAVPSPPDPAAAEPAPEAETQPENPFANAPVPAAPEVPAASPETAAVAATDIPAPPTPAETQAAAEPVVPVPVEAKPEQIAAAEPVVVPAPSQSPVADVKTEPAPTPKAEPVVEAPVVVDTPAPQETQLAQAPVEPEPAPVAQSRKEPEPEVTKPAKVPETVYFDAPGAKAMTDLPTPRMDTKRGKNESIIIVGNMTDGGVAEGTITATNQDSSVVAASRALRLGRFDAALEMYNDLYAANPRDSRILMGRAVTLQKLGRTSDAIRAYEEALDVDHNNTEAVVNLMGLVRKEQPAIALEKLLALKARHPNNPGIIAQLGVAYADAGNLDDAAKNLMAAARLEPKNPQHFFNLGVIAERMKSRPQAIAYYEKALEIDAVYGTGRGIDRERIYDRLSRLRD